MSVFVASGDAGAAGCSAATEAAGTGAGVNGLCSSPYSTCVGGTEFNEGSSAAQYWGDSEYGELRIGARLHSRAGVERELDRRWKRGCGRQEEARALCSHSPKWQAEVNGAARSKRIESRAGCGDGGRQSRRLLHGRERVALDRIGHFSGDAGLRGRDGAGCGHDARSGAGECQSRVVCAGERGERSVSHLRTRETTVCPE